MDDTRDLGATRTALTNTAIDALPVGKYLNDDRVPGLSVRRRRGGVSFMLYYRTRTGIARRPKIGDYGVLSIAQARDIAKKMLAAVAAGDDPSRERQSERMDPTLTDLWTRCEMDVYNGGRAWDKEAKRLFTLSVPTRLKTQRVRDIGYSDVKALHTSMAKTPSQANRVVAVLSRMFTEAERLEWRDQHSNPCSNVQRYPEMKRKRYAKPSELAAIGPLLEAEAEKNPAGVAFLYLLAFSGARPSEIARATWAQLERVDNGCGVLRIDHGKTGQRDVFLPPQAMAVIDKLPKSTPTITGLADTPKKLWRRIRANVGCTDLWARDLRRTFATAGLSSGVSIGQLGELLGHASAQTTKIYAKLAEDPALRAAEAIAGRMEKMLNGA